jgi:ankyrin repeat protein
LEQNSAFDRDLLNQKDQDGLTALHWAVKKNIRKSGVFHTMLVHGGDPSLTDSLGRTVMDYAIDRYLECEQGLKNSSNKYDPQYYFDKIHLFAKIRELNTAGAQTSRDTSALNLPDSGGPSIAPFISKVP